MRSRSRVRRERVERISTCQTQDTESMRTESENAEQSFAPARSVWYVGVGVGVGGRGTNTHILGLVVVNATCRLKGCATIRLRMCAFTRKPLSNEIKYITVSALPS